MSEETGADVAEGAQDVDTKPTEASVGASVDAKGQADVKQADDNNAKNQPEDEDLEALLSRFDQYTSTGEQSDKDEDVSLSDDEPITGKQAEQYFKKLQSQMQMKQKIEEDTAKAISAVKGDLNIPDSWVRGILEMEAMENEKFATAFALRDKDPSAWEKILKVKSKELRKHLGGGQKGADLESVKNDVASAVHSAKTETPPEVEQASNMEMLSKLGRYRYEIWRREQMNKKKKA